MGKALAAVALQHLTAPTAVDDPGRCQQWVRECVQDLYGARFNPYHRRTAKASAREWQLARDVLARQGVLVMVRSPGHTTGPPLPGDILYKTGGPYGHVGIVVEGRRVAENSTAHIAGPSDTDARGMRPLSRYGAWDVLVRLPDPPGKEVEVEAVVAWPNGKHSPYKLVNGSATVTIGVREVAEALGAEVDTDAWPTIVVKRGA